MTWAHLHLALNHVPVVGIVIGLLLLGFAVLRRSRELTRAAFWLIVTLAIITVVVYLTGEPAEELVEGLPGVSEPLIEQHETVALVATLAMSVLGLAAVVGLIRGRRDHAGSASYSKAVLVLALIVTGLMAWTANSGGQIRHPEIRADRGAAGPGEADPGESQIHED